MKRHPHRPPLPVNPQHGHLRHARFSLRADWFQRFLLLAGVAGLAASPLLPLLLMPAAIAQGEALESQEDALIEEYALPAEPAPAPVYRPAPRPAPIARPAPAPRPAPIARPAPAPAPVYVPPARPAPAPRPAPIARPAPAPEPVATEATEPETSAILTQDGASDQTKQETEKQAAKDSTPVSRYILEFNRSPVVGNSLRMRGVYSERRLGFNRPTAWDMQSIQALIRYQHSPALLADRSHLTVRVNGTSVGSVPLNQKKSAIGEVLVDIPPSLIQDYNEIVLVAQQNNDKSCSNPADPALWTEILPDSRLILDYQPKAIPLAFDSYPYPFFDELALDANRIAYALPNRTEQNWLTAVSRFHAGMGRRAKSRPLESRFVKDAEALEWNEGLVVVGMPDEHTVLATMEQLPFKVEKGKILDAEGKAFSASVGILMLTTLNDGVNPALIATGNGPEGVLKAVRALQDGQSAKIAAGQGIVVADVSEPQSPALREWPGHLPLEDEFRLGQLRQSDGQTFEDVTVRTSSSPSIEVDFRALPDDRFLRGNTMELVYSYGPQLDPRTSAVEVAIDDVVIAGERLTNVKGETNARVDITLPEELIKPDSKLRIGFNLNPRGSADCGVVTDRQLWATLHGDTKFQLKRETSVTLPDLKLTQVGYPFAAPQDLSSTTLVVPDQANAAVLGTLLEVSERLGRTSNSNDIQLEAYPAAELPEDVKDSEHLIVMGTRDRFPLQEALQSSNFSLSQTSLRTTDGGKTALQTLSDRQGVIQQIISPWNQDRVVLALAAEGDDGLNTIQQVLENDIWFFQLDGDTVLVSSNSANPSPYDPKAYELEVLKQSKTRRIEDVSVLSKASRFIQERWFVLPTAIVSLALLMYGISQISLKRVDGGSK